MGKTLKYVKEFDFGPQKTYVQGYCRGGPMTPAKKGGAVVAKKYADGGSVASGKPVFRPPASVGSEMPRVASVKGPGRRAAAAQPKITAPTPIPTPTRLRPSGASSISSDRMASPLQRAAIGAKQAEMRNQLALQSRALPAQNAARPAMKRGGSVSPAKMSQVMGEFKAGALHSGSKSGPVVKSRDQAVAIAMNQGRRKK